MEENSHEQNEAIIVNYCEKNKLDPTSHKQVVALTASLIQMDGELLEETVFNRIDSDGEWLPEVKKRWERGSKSRSGQDVKDKKKKPEKEEEKEKEREKEEEKEKESRDSGKEQEERKKKERKEKKNKKEKKEKKGEKEGTESNPSLSLSQATSDDEKH